MNTLKFIAKNGRIDYLVTDKENPTREYVKSIMDARWSVEVYHREIKQNCGIARRLNFDYKVCYELYN
nr:hypothetical protein [Candidatus Arsenophonus triatominarum]